MKISTVLERSLNLHDVTELDFNKMYSIRELGLRINTPEGVADLTHIIRKRERQAIVNFADGRTIDCSTNHLFAQDGATVSVSALSAGDVVDSTSGPIAIASIVIGDVVDVYDVSVDNKSRLFYTKNGIVHHNTGKTHMVEKALSELGMEDGAGYFKNTTSASASGMYRTLYNYRDSVILFDDCDAVFKDQESRNLLKAATDTKPKRKLGWSKSASWIYRGDPADLDKLQNEDNPDFDFTEAPDEENKKYPRYFDFSGRIIFISNLQLDQIDPDGALRTRGFIMSINPTNDELINFMESILDNIKLENNLQLDSDSRRKVLEIIKSGHNKEEMNIRKLVRGMNMAAAGIPGWETLVSRYA